MSLKYHVFVDWWDEHHTRIMFDVSKYDTFDTLKGRVRMMVGTPDFYLETEYPRKSKVLEVGEIFMLRADMDIVVNL